MRYSWDLICFERPSDWGDSRSNSEDTHHPTNMRDSVLMEKQEVYFGIPNALGLDTVLTQEECEEPRPAEIYSLYNHLRLHSFISSAILVPRISDEADILVLEFLRKGCNHINTAISVPRMSDLIYVFPSWGSQDKDQGYLTWQMFLSWCSQDKAVAMSEQLCQYQGHLTWYMFFILQHNL